MAAPAGMAMTDFKGLSKGGEAWGGEEGSIIAQTMGPDAKNFQIVRQIGHDGCCYAITHCSCFGDIEGRSYRVIGENFVEQNDAVNLCCFCCTKDIITKVYMDQPPFTTCLDKMCGGPEMGAYITQEDTNYCCYCIPCVCWYNLCTKPCYGGFVAKVPCERGSFCFNCQTRCCNCCIMPIFNYVEDAQSVAQILQAQQNAFIKARGDVSTGHLAVNDVTE